MTVTVIIVLNLFASFFAAVFGSLIEEGGRESAAATALVFWIVPFLCACALMIWGLE